MRYLLALILAGCASDMEYRMPPHINYITVYVVWGTDREIAQQCNGGLACATVGRYNGDTVKIWAVPPTSFYDDRRVCTLGHELLHALGATHKGGR